MEEINNKKNGDMHNKSSGVEKNPSEYNFINWFETEHHLRLLKLMFGLEKKDSV